MRSGLTGSDKRGKLPVLREIDGTTTWLHGMSYEGATDVDKSLAFHLQLGAWTYGAGLGKNGERFLSQERA